MKRHALSALLLLWAASALAQPPGICRVEIKSGGPFSSIGSGVLIDWNGTQGLVLTAAHVADSTTGHVKFLGSTSARIISAHVDKHRNDVAVLVIVEPTGEMPKASNLATSFRGEGRYRMYGLGPLGSTLRRYEGAINGWGLPQGASHKSPDFRCFVRKGDSGGPIYREDGDLVGVIWGHDASSRTTTGTVGRPVVDLVKRVITQCPGGNCYRPSQPLRRALGLDPRFEAPDSPERQPPGPPNALGDLQAELAELRMLLARHRISIAAIKERLAALADINPPGPVDPIDPSNPPINTPPPPEWSGQISELTQEIARLRMQQNAQTQEFLARLDEIENNQPSVAAIISQLPPQRVEWETLAGNTLTQEKPLGQTLKFRSVEVGAQ
jgi:hypothetical protein